MAGLWRPRAMTCCQRYWMVEESSSLRASFMASSSPFLPLGIVSPLSRCQAAPPPLGGPKRSAPTGYGPSLLLLQPGHHGPQLRPYLLDRVLGVLATQGQEAGAAGLVLQDPLAGEGAVLDGAE